MRFLTKILLTMSLACGISYAKPFKLDLSHSEVGFSVKHLMISNVKGKFGMFESKFDFDMKTKEFKTLEAIIETESINTDNDSRDNHLKSADFFDADKFDEIKFVMTSYKKTSDDEGVMKGNLTIKGITKPISLNVEIGGVVKFKGKDRIGFALNGKLNRKDFGLTWNKVLETGGVAVGDKIKINAEVEGIEK